MRSDYTVSVLLLSPSGGFFFMSLDAEYLQIFVCPPAGVYLGKWNSANHLIMYVAFCPKTHSWRVCSWSSKAPWVHHAVRKPKLATFRGPAKKPMPSQHPVVPAILGQVPNVWMKTPSRDLSLRSHLTTAAWVAPIRAAQMNPSTPKPWEMTVNYCFDPISFEVICYTAR